MVKKTITKVPFLEVLKEIIGGNPRVTFPSYNEIQIQDGNGNKIASTFLREFHNCCGIVICNESNLTVYVDTETREKILSLLHAAAIQLAWYKRYTLILYANQTLNKPLNKSLEFTGFEKYSVFRNKKTGNNLKLSGQKVIQQTQYDWRGVSFD